MNSEHQKKKYQTFLLVFNASVYTLSSAFLRRLVITYIEVNLVITLRR